MKLTIRWSPKSLWLLVLMLTSVNFWYIKPLGGLFASFGIFFFLFVLACGHFLFRPRNKWHKITVSSASTPTRLIYLGVVLSFVSALIYYGQGLLNSFLTARAMWALLALPVLLAVKPSYQDIRSATGLFVAIFFFISFVDSILDIEILQREFFYSEENRRSYIDEGDFFHLLDGWFFTIPMLAFQLGDLKNKFSVRNLLRTLGVFVLIFLLQNRTMLMASSLILMIAVFSIKGASRGNTIIFKTLSLLFVGLMIVVTSAQMASLLSETVDDLGSDKYNRFLSLNYYLLEAPDSFVKAIFGCGMISAKVNPIMQELMKEGIYNSDVGLVGMWNLFGLIPVITIIVYLVRGMFSRTSPFMIRCFAIILAIGSLTICCYTDPSKILWLCFYFYLMAILRIEDNPAVAEGD